MTVKELRKLLDRMDGGDTVYICVNEPAGWICPDGAVVGLKGVYNGFDWHAGDVLLVPEHSLDIHDVGAWSGRAKTDEEEKHD
jgi:hypothetical protein